MGKAPVRREFPKYGGSERFALEEGDIVPLEPGEQLELPVGWGPERDAEDAEVDDSEE